MKLKQIINKVKDLTIKEFFRRVGFFCTRHFLERLSLYKVFKKFKNKEKYISYGNENPEKTFYVIRWNRINGIGGVINVVFSAIQYAISNNFIPVVDLCTFPNMYLSKKDIGKTNIWEWFFEQPCGYTLDDIVKSKNVILSSLSAANNWVAPSFIDDEKDSQISVEYRRLYKKYVRYNKQTIEFFTERKNRIISKDDRVLGVKLRGSDLLVYQSGHAMQPSVEISINAINNILSSSNYNKIFLSCEDETLTKIVKSNFGDKVIMNEESFKELKKGHACITVEGTPFDDARIYLSTLWIASQCDSFYGTTCGGTHLIWCESYDKFEICEINFVGLYK